MSRRDKFFAKLKLAIELLLLVLCTTASIIAAINEAHDLLFFLVPLDAIIAAKIFSDVHEITKATGVSAPSRLKRFFRKIFKPVIDRFSDKYDWGKKYLSSKGETKFVFDFGIKDKIKSIFDSRTRINPKKGKSNGEKVRLMYIKKMLELSASGRDVKESLTPKEASRLLSPGESGELFSVYERVRYENGYKVSGETMKSLAGK